MESQEQIIRKVSKVGNGAHIFAPKEWINEQVLIIRIEKKTLQEKILEKIAPYLDKITSVILFGSNARKESNENSDIDILIISKEKLKIEKEEGLDIISISEDEIDKAIEINPILMYSIFSEGKPIINESYLQKLKKIKTDPKKFKKFIDETEKSIVSDLEINELDKKTGKYSSDSLIYSLFLRLRGIYIIKCLLGKKDFSNKAFSEWIGKTTYQKIYPIYTQVRKEIYGKDTKVPIEETERLINFLKEELNKIK
jgi:predicted nucleotidyltransferase